MAQRTRPVVSFTADKAVLEAAKKAAKAARLPLSRWVEQVLAKAAGLPSEKVYPEWAVQWLRGADTGVSSNTLASHMLDLKPLVPRWRSDAPHDAYDLGRCIRLLDLASQNGEDWRVRIGEMAAYPEWAPLVPEWAELEADYQRDLKGTEEWRGKLYTGKGGRRRKTPRKDLPTPVPLSTQRIDRLRGADRGGLRVSFIIPE